MFILNKRCILEGGARTLPELIPINSSESIHKGYPKITKMGRCLLLTGNRSNAR